VSSDEPPVNLKRACAKCGGWVIVSEQPEGVTTLNLCINCRGTTEEKMTNYATTGQIVTEMRKACGCYNCAGFREIGQHTIQDPNNPRTTPTSCCLDTLVKFCLENPPVVEPDNNVVEKIITAIEARCEAATDGLDESDARTRERRSAQADAYGIILNDIEDVRY